MPNEAPPEAAHAIRTLRADVDAALIDATGTLRHMAAGANTTVPQDQAINLLTRNGSELKSAMDAIDAQLTWTPYVAFYGETNAGKSTLIEALRLFFGDRFPGVGDSIGDGRSDFTREATSHPCIFRGRSFTLIDVPGIEGKESSVQDTIRSALARSQIVFYVTPDARPPQGGEKDREGTLEKIARQLKPQARVWAIWNKKIHSPRALEKPLLVQGSDEWCSLHEGATSLDAKMREALGERYRTCLPVSARPAFLALAAHLAPESEMHAERSRFLERIPEARLLSACNIDQIAELIAKELPDAKDIFQANFRKLAVPIRDWADGISRKAREEFLEPAFALKAVIKSLEPKMEGITDDIRRNLRRLSDELTQATIASIRSQMMEAIQAGIDSNKELEEKFKAIVSSEKISLNKKIEDSIRKNISDAQKSFEEAVKVMKMELAEKDVFSVPNFKAEFDHSIEFTVRNDVDWLKLTTVVLTNVAAIYLTGGLSLILSIVGLLMGTWNAIASVFDSQRKKDNQKKALNAKIYLVRQELSLSVPKQMQVTTKEIAEFMRSKLRPFKRVCVDYYKAGNVLSDVGRKLSAASDPVPSTSAT